MSTSSITTLRRQLIDRIEEAVNATFVRKPVGGDSVKSASYVVCDVGATDKVRYRVMQGVLDIQFDIPSTIVGRYDRHVRWASITTPNRETTGVRNIVLSIESGCNGRTPSEERIGAMLAVGRKILHEMLGGRIEHYRIIRQYC